MLLLAGSCHNNGTGSQPVTENFRGTYSVKQTSVVGEKKDSLLLAVTDNAKFSFHFYPTSSNDVTEYCDCEGSVYDWGSNRITFNPTQIFGGNCDSKRVPSGLFNADFVSHGDTIIFSRSSNDTTFVIRLFTM